MISLGVITGLLGLGLLLICYLAERKPITYPPPAPPAPDDVDPTDGAPWEHEL